MAVMKVGWFVFFWLPSNDHLDFYNTDLIAQFGYQSLCFYGIVGGFVIKADPYAYYTPIHTYSSGSKQEFYAQLYLFSLKVVLKIFR